MPVPTGLLSNALMESRDEFTQEFLLIPLIILKSLCNFVP